MRRKYDNRSSKVCWLFSEVLLTLSKLWIWLSISKRKEIMHLLLKCKKIHSFWLAFNCCGFWCVFVFKGIQWLLPVPAKGIAEKKQLKSTHWKRAEGDESTAFRPNSEPVRKRWGLLERSGNEESCVRRHLSLHFDKRWLGSGAFSLLRALSLPTDTQAHSLHQGFERSLKHNVL